jgi:hypothetical protein
MRIRSGALMATCLLEKWSGRAPTLGFFDFGGNITRGDFVGGSFAL